MSFAHIQAQFDTYKLSCFLQARLYIQTHILLLPGVPVVSPLDKCLTVFTKSKGFISYLYWSLDSWNEHNIVHVLSVWETDLGSNYEVDWVLRACHVTFGCNRFKEIQCKLDSLEHPIFFINVTVACLISATDTKQMMRLTLAVAVPLYSWILVTSNQGIKYCTKLY